MPPLLDDDLAVRCGADHGAHIAVRCRRLRHALKDVHARDHAGDVLNGNKPLLDPIAQLCEKAVLERNDLLLRAEDLRLELFEFLGDEPLRIREGLFPNVVRRYAVAAAVAHLDVVAEHLVVADFERLDTRAIPLALLHLLQERLAVV